MKKFIYIILFLISFSAEAQLYSPEELKAMKIYEIFKYLVWEDDENKIDFKFGVYKGSDEFISALKKFKPSTFLTGIKITIENVQDYYLADQYDIFIIPEKYNNIVPEVLKIIENKPTALFTENYPDQEKIIFDIYLESSKQAANFRFNLQNLETHKISIFYLNEFYQLGGDDINARSLLKNTEQKMFETQKKLRLKERELREKEKLIAIQQKKIDEQKRQLKIAQQELYEKNKQLKNLEEHLTTLNQQILQTKKHLEEQQKIFAKKELELQNKQKQIALYQNKLNEIYSEYNKQNLLLKQQKDQIKKISEEVEQKKAELRKLNITIQTQRFALTIFFSLLVIIGILTFFIFRSYKKQKLLNTLLEEQKNEIQAQAKELEKINMELEKLSLVASETSNGVVILDKTWNIEWLNKGFTKLYGYTLQLLQNQYGLNISNVKIYENIDRYLEKSIKEKQSVAYEHKVLSKTKGEIWIQTNITPIIKNDDQIDKIVIVDSDITEIKKAEEQIKLQNQKIIEQARELELKNKELEKLSLVAEKTDNGVAIADSTGTIEWVNPGFERLFKMSFEKFKEKFGDNIILPIYNQNILDIIEKAILEGKSAVFTYKFSIDYTKNVWIQTTLTPLFNAKNEISRIFAIYSDITKIKEAEEKIAKQNKNITNSIQYASRIQRALLPSEEFLAMYLDDFFVLYKPKDIVSGDFYWLKEKNNKIFLTAADCTGHGVPGAFMSLLGISFLNEIISKLDDDQLFPNIILDNLREMIITALKQREDPEHNKDGIDMALVMIDKINKEVHYAGANNQLILVRDGKLMEYRADDMPIGIYYRKYEPFSNKIIKYQSNDAFYMFSDGYLDQFGGPKGKKFMIKRFRNLILQLYDLPMEQQKILFDKTFIEWKGNKKQVDDILVFGFRLFD